MSRTYRRGERRIRVRGIRRKNPDIPKLARALIELAQVQLEAEAQAEHEVRRKTEGKHPRPDRGAA
jgi:hypothetical protein